MAAKSPVKKVATRSTRTAKKKPVTKTGDFLIDYPQQDETLLCPQYTIRLTAEKARYVEVSINNGEWQPCRINSGYWWYDWHLMGPGSLSIIARMKTSDSTWQQTSVRTCYYPG